MLTYDVGHVAVSLAGHDKESRYLIVGIKEDILYLADGDKKTFAKTKKKNKKHKPQRKNKHIKVALFIRIGIKYIYPVVLGTCGKYIAFCHFFLSP